MERADIVIIGGGVIGCALAMELATNSSRAANRTHDIFVLEELPRVAMASSSRNSGVIHSGVYYTKDSLKAKLCVAGNPLTYEFCAAHGVPYRNTGKLVVATHPGEEHVLEELKAKGEANGVERMQIVDAAEIRRLEPHVAGVAALWIPSTGIVASEELTKTYARVAKEHGANIVASARVIALEPDSEGVRVTCEIGSRENGDTPQHETLHARCVVNCAGLYADEVAAMLGFAKYRIYPVRGEYCELIRGRSDLVRGLVYPLPHPEGMSLGVHLTRTLWDTVLLGPTARYVAEKDDYESGRLKIENFVEMARPLLPEIHAEDLRLGYSGLRAKLVPPKDASGTEPATGAADFVITRDPNVRAAIHLIGMESPGLTSALAIARYVVPMVQETLN
jgi:glycerol-3-phosphate dehydrogenase